MRNKLLTVVGLGMFSLSTHGAVIVGEIIAIDFGTTAPTVTNWNQITTTSITVPDAVELTSGNLSRVSITYAGVLYFESAGGTGPASSFVNISTDNSIDVDWSGTNSSGVNNDVHTLTVTSLDDSLSYQITGGHTRANASIANNFTYEVTSNNGGSVSGAQGSFEFTSVSNSGGEIVLSFTDEVAKMAISQFDYRNYFKA